MSADSPRRGLNARCGGLSVPAIVPPQVVSDRSILDSAIGFINEVTLAHQPHTDSKDTITWARFESTADISDPRFGEDWELEGNVAPPLLLILGYGLGVQVWAIPANGEAVEVLSWRHGSVNALRVLPTPSAGTEDTGRRADELVDIFAEKRPLMAMCDGGGSKSTGGAQTQFCAVNFVSLKTGAQVKTIKFKNSVLDIIANRTSIAITFNERIAVFDARTLEDRLSITTCYPSPGINPNPVALGSRWLAYAEHKLLHSKRSGGGCDGEGVASYTATVLNAAKSFGKGLRELGEQVAAGLTGVSTTGCSGNNSKNSSFDSNSSGDVRQPGIVTVIDIKHPIKDVSPTSGTPISINGSDPFVAHFIAHSEALVAMEFDNSGMLLVTADKRGHDFHVFRIQPHPVGSSLAAVHHLYVLHRGDTSAKVQNIAYSLDSRWIAVSTLRGTTHVFPITPYGGAMGVRTHTSLHVVNKLSRFHRSAGLSAEGRSSSPISHSESTTFSQSLIPYHNPTLPPYTRPTVVLPLAQLRQPFVLGSPPGSAVPSSKPGSGGAGTGSASSQRQRLSSLSDDNGKPLSVCAIFAKSRSWLLDPPNATREAPHRMQRKAVDSLFVMAGHGALIQYDLDTKLASNVAKEKICDETPIELEVEAKAQWNLWRKDGSQEIMPPLTSDNWLIKNRNSCMLTDSTRQFDDTDDRADSWLSQVEIITHAGPHRRLWMGPQFVFKTYNTPSGSNLSHIEAEAVEIGVTTTSAAATAAARAERSSPLNMPLNSAARASVPVLIESGSYSSIEQSPKLMDRFRHEHLDSDFSVSHGDSRLKEDLADAMRESPSMSKDVTGRLLSDTAFDSAPFYDALAEHIEDDNLDTRRSAAAALAHALPNIYSYAAYSSQEAPSPPRSIEKVVNPLGTVTTITAGMSSEFSTDILDEVVSQLAAEDCVIHENCDESLFRPVVAIFCDEKSRIQGEEARRQQELCKPPEMVGNKLIVPVIDKERDDELCKKEKQKAEEGRGGGGVTVCGVIVEEQLSKEDQRKFAELAQMSKKCQVPNLGNEQKSGNTTKQKLQDQNSVAKCLQHQKSEERDLEMPETFKKTTKSSVKEKPKLAENTKEILSSSKDSTDRNEVKKLSKTSIKKELRKSLERDEIEQETLAYLKKDNQVSDNEGAEQRKSEESEVQTMQYKKELTVELRGTQKAKELVERRQIKSEERKKKELERNLTQEDQLKDKRKYPDPTEICVEEDQSNAEEEKPPVVQMTLTKEKFQRKSEEREEKKLASEIEPKLPDEKIEKPLDLIKITPLLGDNSTKKTAENAKISANLITANAENINSKPKTKTAKQPEEELVLKSSGKETIQSSEVGASTSKTTKLKDNLKASSSTKKAGVKTGQLNAEDLEDSLIELDKQHATKDSQKQIDSVSVSTLPESKDEAPSNESTAVVELKKPVDIFANETKTSKKKKQKLNKSASNSESEEVVEVIRTSKVTKAKNKKSDVSDVPMVQEKKSSISSEDSFADLANSLLEKNQSIEQTMYISFSEIMEKEVNVRSVDETDGVNKKLRTSKLKSSTETSSTSYVEESIKSSKDAPKKSKAGQDFKSISEAKTNANLIKYEDGNKDDDKNKESVASTNLLFTFPKPTKEITKVDKNKSAGASALVTKTFDELNDDALAAPAIKGDSRDKENEDKAGFTVKQKDIHDSQAQLKSKTESGNQVCLAFNTVVSPLMDEHKKDHSRINKGEEKKPDESKGVIKKSNLKKTNLEDNNNVELLKLKEPFQSELHSGVSPTKAKKDETSKESKLNFKQPSCDQLTTMASKKNVTEVLKGEFEIMPPPIKPDSALTETKKSKKGKADNKLPEVTPTYAITEQPKRTIKEGQKEGLKDNQYSRNEFDASSTTDSKKTKLKTSEKLNAGTSEDINKKCEAKDETLVFFDKFSPEHKKKTTVDPPKTTETLKPASAWQTMSGAAMINKNLESFANATVEENYPSLGSIGKINIKKSKATMMSEERKLSLKAPILPTNVKNTQIVQDEPLSTTAQKHKKSRKPLGTTFDDFPMLKSLDDLPPLPQLEPLELTPCEKSDKLAFVGESQVSLINFESPKQENPILVQKITPPPRGFTEQNLIFALCGSLHYENENSGTAYKSLIENINDEQYMSLEQSSQGTTTNEKSPSTSSTSSSASEEAVVDDLGEKKLSKKQHKKLEQGLELLKQQQQKQERKTANECLTDAEDADDDDDDEELQPLISMSESKMDNYTDPMMLESKSDHFANNKCGAGGVTTTDSEGPMAATTPSDDNNYSCFRPSAANTTTTSTGNKLKTKKLEHKINLIAAIEAATSSSTSSAEESGVEGSNRGATGGTGDTAVVTMSVSTTAAGGSNASSIPTYAATTAQLSASKKKTKRRKR